MDGDKENKEERKDPKDTPEFWRRWIKAAKTKAEPTWAIAREAWREYESGEDGTGDSYPIYWSSCKTIEPAYYSRTPQLINKRRFDTDDLIAGTACLINKRLGDYLVENSNFDSVMMAAVGDYIHADKTTVQVVYEADFEDVPLFLDESGNYVREDGSSFTGEVFNKEDDIFGKQAIQGSQKIYLSPVTFDEVLHTPSAKTEAEIREKAYFVTMTKDEALERFSVDPQNITWKKTRTGDDVSTSRGRELNTGEEYLELWECYSKPNEMVYWVSDQYKEDFLDKKQNPYQLRDFWPSTPFIVGSKPSKNMYSTPVFKRLKSNIKTLSKQAQKIYELMDAIDPRAIIDGTNDDLAALINLDSGKYISVRNFQTIIEKGGLANLIQFLPVGELVSAVTTFMQAEGSFKETFFEVFGVPDILRGASDPVETAAAQQIAASAAHDRFKFQKKQIRQMARDAIELMIDLAYKVLDDESIIRLVGYDYMKGDDQQRFFEALAILRDDDTRLIRIDIETDSMSFVDEQLRSQQMSQAVQAVTGGLKDVAQTAKADPQIARASLQALLASLETFGPSGMQFQDQVKGALEQIIEAAENPPQSPPPPDYEMLKIQNEQMKLQQAGQIKSQELILEERRLALEERKEIVGEQLEQIQTQFQQQLDSALLQIENQRVSIEQFKAQVQANESQMEEIRLARETDLKTYSDAVMAAQNTAPSEPVPPQIIQVNPPAMPPISLNVEASKPMRKILRIVDDPITGQTSIVPEDVPEPVLPIMPFGG